MVSRCPIFRKTIHICDADIDLDPIFPFSSKFRPAERTSYDLHVYRVQTEVSVWSLSYLLMKYCKPVSMYQKTPRGGLLTLSSIHRGPIFRTFFWTPFPRCLLEVQYDCLDDLMPIALCTRQTFVKSAMVSVKIILRMTAHSHVLRV